MAARESMAVIRPWQLPRAQTDSQVPQAGPALSFFCSFSLRRSLIAGQPSPTLKHLCTRPHSLRFLFLTRTRMQRAACIYSNLCPRAWPAVPKATFLTPVVSSIQRSCLPPPFRLMRTENCMQVVHRTPNCKFSPFREPWASTLTRLPALSHPKWMDSNYTVQNIRCRISKAVW